MGKYKTAMLFLGCVYLFCVEDTHAISCLKCDHHQDLSDCEGFETCQSDEVCYVQRYSTTQSTIPVYRAGCKTVQECQLISCNKGRHVPGELVTCTQCCSSDFCNQNLCGGKYAGVNDTLRCFGCQHVGHNDTSVCSQIQDCDKDEQCLVNYGYHNQPYLNYNFGCEKKSRCDFLHHIALLQHLTLDTTCCDSPLCNVHPNKAVQNHSVVPAGSCGNRCPNGWVTYEQSCYMFSHYTGDFEEAELYCRQHGARLVEIENSYVNNFLRLFAKDYQPRDFWLGITDKLVEGVWKWYSTNSDATFSNWGIDEPQNNGTSPGEDCAVFHHTQNYGWADVACTTINAALCELRDDGGSILVG